VACTAASDPPLRPKPSCLGASIAAAFSDTSLHATFPARRLQVYPIAIGLIPPPFLAIAIREAPKRMGRTVSGV
jgi:hypothetical protein